MVDTSPRPGMPVVGRGWAPAGRGGEGSLIASCCPGTSMQTPSGAPMRIILPAGMLVSTRYFWPLNQIFSLDCLAGRPGDFVCTSYSTTPEVGAGAAQTLLPAAASSTTK